MDETQLLSVPLVVMLLMEVVKYVVRRFIKKDPNFDFIPEFYTLTIPFLTFVVGWLFGLIGWAEPFAMDFMYLLRWGLNIVISLVMYNMGIRPLKDYAELYKFNKEIGENEEESNQDIG